MATPEGELNLLSFEGISFTEGGTDRLTEDVAAAVKQTCVGICTRCCDKVICDPKISIVDRKVFVNGEKFGTKKCLLPRS